MRDKVIELRLNLSNYNTNRTLMDLYKIFEN